jgi:hypothetical protein
MTRVGATRCQGFGNAGSYWKIRGRHGSPLFFDFLFMLLRHPTCQQRDLSLNGTLQDPERYSGGAEGRVSLLITPVPT